MNEAAQVVTAQGVGTDGVFQEGERMRGIIVLVQRVGCEQRGKQRGQGEHDDRSRSEDGRAVSDEAREEQSQQAGTTSVGLIEASVEFDCFSWAEELIRAVSVVEVSVQNVGKQIHRDI